MASNKPQQNPSSNPFRVVWGPQRFYLSIGWKTLIAFALVVFIPMLGLMALTARTLRHAMEDETLRGMEANLRGAWREFGRLEHRGIAGRDGSHQGSEQQLQRTRTEEHLSFWFERNIVYFDSGDLLGSTWTNNQFRVDSNVYFDARPEARPETLRFSGASLAWRVPAVFSRAAGEAASIRRVGWFCRSVSGSRKSRRVLSEL